MAFASVTELDEFLGETTGFRGEVALSSATALIVSALGWDPRQSPRVLAVRGPTCTVILPARYVTAVSISRRGVTQDPTAYVWNADGIIEFGSWWTDLVVTYTAGWAAGQLPSEFRDICLEQAVRHLDSRGRSLRSRSWSLGAETETETYAVPAERPEELRSDPRLSRWALEVLA